MPSSLVKRLVRKLDRGVCKGQFRSKVVERMAEDLFSMIYCFGLGTDGRIELAVAADLLSQHPTWSDLERADLEQLIYQTRSATSHTISIEDGFILI